MWKVAPICLETVRGEGSSRVGINWKFKQRLIGGLVGPKECVDRALCLCICSRDVALLGHLCCSLSLFGIGLKFILCEEWKDF